MHEELYGHLLAALRFGAGEDGCQAAVSIAFEPPPKLQGEMSFLHRPCGRAFHVWVMRYILPFVPKTT